MDEPLESSLVSRLSAALFLCVVTVAGIAWFLHSSYCLFEDIYKLSPVVTFNKGAMYMLGASIGSLFLAVGVVYVAIFLKTMPKRMESILIRGVVVGIVVMFAFPQVVHFGVSKFVKGRDYIICQKMGSQWLLYAEYVYAADADICDQMADEKKSGNDR